VAVVAVLACGAATEATVAAEQRFASRPARVTLVELYTSEGCSSCPPAERWLGELRTAPGLWRDFVPVAWHVDYWNRLGLARPDFRRRSLPLANTPWPQLGAVIRSTRLASCATARSGAGARKR